MIDLLYNISLQVPDLLIMVGCAILFGAGGGVLLDVVQCEVVSDDCEGLLIDCLLGLEHSSHVVLDFNPDGLEEDLGLFLVDHF